MRLDQLQVLYSQLRIGKKRTQDILRALPSGVVEALYVMLDPESPTNPFRDNTARWRAYLVFVLLLHLGLRRGELLILSSDAIKHGFDSRLGGNRYWLSVVENPYEQEDQRFSTPSIKTVNSVRQIPVSELTARIVQVYVENYRGKPAHSYLMNSQKGSPLSAESVTKLFQKITAALPSSALQELKDRTGLQQEIGNQLGPELRLRYDSPQLLELTAQLGSHAVCTNPASCSQAGSTPIPANESWHYSLGHWVEDEVD